MAGPLSTLEGRVTKVVEVQVLLPAPNPNKRFSSLTYLHSLSLYITGIPLFCTHVGTVFGG
jgi:hypothetical protein